MAELIPLEIARGRTPVKNVRTRPAPGGESFQTPIMAPPKLGRDEALHIIRVFTTSKGVVAAAATEPAMRPITMSAPVLLSSLLFFMNERCIVRRVSYAANLTAMSGTSSRSVGM